MEAVRDTLDPQKSIIWFNCLQRTHTLFQGLVFSPQKIFPSLFIIFKIWPVTLAPDTTVGRSPTSALDHGPSWLTQQEGANGPMKTAGLVLDVLHVYAYLFSGLFLVPFPPFLPSSGKSLQLSNFVSTVKFS